MLAFLFWQHHASLLLTVPIAMLLTIIGCFMTRAFSWRDVQMVRRFLFTRLHRHNNTAPTPRSEPATTAPTPDLSAIAHYPSQFQDISDYPTLILPRVRVTNP